MTLLLTLLALIIFFIGAYYMGNLVLDTFDEDLSNRLINSTMGILIWLVLFCLLMLFAFVYHYIGIVLK